MQLVVLAHVHHVAFEQDQLRFDEVGDLGVDVLGVRGVRIERVEPSLEDLLHRHVEGVRADRLFRQRIEKPGIEVPRLHDRIVHLGSFLTLMDTLPEKRKALHLEERENNQMKGFSRSLVRKGRERLQLPKKSWRGSQGTLQDWENNLATYEIILLPRLQRNPVSPGQRAFFLLQAGRMRSTRRSPRPPSRGPSR